MTMRPYTDHRGGLNHLVDAQIGRAFPIIHKVSQHLDAIEYVASVYESGRSRDIVLRTNITKEWVEWQYKGDTKWTVLYRFSDLLGGNVADVIQAERELAAELDALRTKLEQDVEDISPMVAEVRATHGVVLAAKNEALAAQSTVGAYVVTAERAATTAVTAGAQAQAALECVREQATVVTDAANTVVRQVTHAETHADRAQAAAQAAQAAQVVIQDLVPEVREHADFTRRSVVEVAELRNQTSNSEELAGQFRNEARAALDTLLSIAPDLTGRIEATEEGITRVEALATTAETALDQLDALRDEVAQNAADVATNHQYVQDTLPVITAARTATEAAKASAESAAQQATTKAENARLSAEAAAASQNQGASVLSVVQAARDAAVASEAGAAVSASAATAANTSALNALAAAVDAKNAAKEFADIVGDSVTLASAAATTATNAAVLAQISANRAEGAATEASGLVTNTFRLSNLLSELAGNAEAQATAQSNLGLGRTDLLDFYNVAKS